jgi:hypothetical protein
MLLLLLSSNENQILVVIMSNKRNGHHGFDAARAAIEKSNKSIYFWFVFIFIFRFQGLGSDGHLPKSIGLISCFIRFCVNDGTFDDAKDLGEWWDDSLDDNVPGWKVR